MNLASAHATLAVLCDAGFLLRDPVHRTYVLGPALAVTGFAALEEHPAIGAAIEQAELLADELGAEIGVTAIAGRDVIFVARRGTPAVPRRDHRLSRATAHRCSRRSARSSWPGPTTPPSRMARPGRAPAPARRRVPRILAEIRERGFSVPMPPIGSPAVEDAMSRVRSEPTDLAAEHHLASVLQHTDEMLVPLAQLAGTDEIVFKTIAAPIFDSLGRVLLSLSVTGPDQPVAVAEVMRLGHRLAQSAAVATRHVRGRVPGEQPIGSAVS